MALAAEQTHQLISTLLPDWRVSEPQGGASLWAELPSAVVRPFIRHAARCGVLLIGDDAFAVREPADRHIRIPFTASETDRTLAIRRLADAWSTFEPQQGSLSGPRATLV